MEQGAKSKAIQIAIIAPARLSRPVTAGKCQEGKVSLRANIGTGGAQPALQPAAPARRSRQPLHPLSHPLPYLSRGRASTANPTGTSALNCPAAGSRQPLPAPRMRCEQHSPPLAGREDYFSCALPAPPTGKCYGAHAQVCPVGWCWAFVPHTAWRRGRVLCGGSRGRQAGAAAKRTPILRQRAAAGRGGSGCGRGECGELVTAADSRPRVGVVSGCPGRVAGRGIVRGPCQGSWWLCHPVEKMVVSAR